MAYTMTRRNFIRRAAGWLALLAGAVPTRLSWSARGSDTGSVRLAFYTDVHARLEWETPKALARAADAVNSNRIDLAIAGGDLITDGFTSADGGAAPRWDAYMQMHRAVKADLYPAIGNHDLVAANPKDGSPAAVNPRSAFLHRMGLDRTYYSFDAVGYHFAILDAIQVTGGPYQYRGTLGAEELEWLRHDLARLPQGTPIVLVTHIPLLTAFYSAVEGATSAAPRNRVVVNNREVLELIDTYNVILVLQGHLHVKELIRWKNTAFIIGGAVCGKWWRGAWHGTGEGFNIVTLSGNRVDWEYLGYGWRARRPPNR